MVAIFLLTKVQEPQTPAQKAGLVGTLGREFVDSWRDLGNDNYLAATSKPLTTQDVTRLTGIADGAAGTFIVSGIESYFGLANRDIWEWIQAMKDRDGPT